MKTVIMAGGKGTRISSINVQVPKPMLPIEGHPILEYQLEALKRQGCRDITLVIGHLGHVIKDYFGNGSNWGVNISYICEEQPLGTAGALYLLKDQMKEDFLLVNGDVIFDIDIRRFYNFHKMQNTTATILTHPNSHPYDSGVIETDGQGKVMNWLHKEDKRIWYKNRVNAGLHMLSPKIFNSFASLKRRDLDRDILEPLISYGELSAYDSPEYIKDMGTPERYYSVINDLKCGKVQSKNLTNKQKAIFLDRDGTINAHVGFLSDINDFYLLDGVAEAVKKINESGYLAIVVTNQPVISRGELSLNGLQEIHNKMETLLGQSGAYLDDIFFCPHHPDKGFKGERAEYKFECNCRKPKPGMLLNAAQKYNIDLTKSWMIGDEASDAAAGKAAGCKVITVGNKNEEAALGCPTLAEAVSMILNKKDK